MIRRAGSDIKVQPQPVRGMDWARTLRQRQHETRPNVIGHHRAGLFDRMTDGQMRQWHVP